MRPAVILGMFLVAAPAADQKPEAPPRFGIEADLEAYPQDSPKAALTSVVKAIDARRIDYLAAHLADPDEVDKRIKGLGGKFDRYVSQFARRLADDPEAVRQLRRFASEGEFNVSGDVATVSLKDVKGRQVFLKKAGGRWYMEDRQKPAK